MEHEGVMKEKRRARMKVGMGMGMGMIEMGMGMKTKMGIVVRVWRMIETALGVKMVETGMVKMGMVL